MQLTPKLHVSTPWGHHQGYKIRVVQGTFVNVNYGIRYKRTLYDTYFISLKMTPWGRNM